MILKLPKRLKTGTALVLFFLISALGFSQGIEDFSNIPPNANNYATRVWTGTNGEIWTAEKARTDQTINGRAIAFTNVANATLTTTIPGGIGDLTLTTQRIFAGNTGTISVSVGGNIVGSFPYGTSAQTTTISGINVAGDVVLILKTDGNYKVAIDDVIWTAGTVEENSAPVITNIQQDKEYVTPSDEVLITADITDSDGIASSELLWGTISGVLSNTIPMINDGSGDNYSVINAIPAHELGTTVYYLIQAIDSNPRPATSISAEMSYTVMDPLGVNNNEMMSQISLYPNPFKDSTFYIHGPNLNGLNVDLEITDMDGRQVFKETFHCQDNKIAVSINKTLASGVYLVKLNSAGQSTQFRLLKE